MNWVELHPPRPYTVIWQRRGYQERFHHTVTACSEREARRQSQHTIACGLGSNVTLWQMVDVTTRALQEELVSAGK